MTLVIRALSAAGLLLVAASSASAQQADGTQPDMGAAATGTAPATVKPGVRVDPPKLDPKLLFDVFKALSKPRSPAPVPTAATPVAPVAPVVAPAPAPMQLPPAATAPAPPKPAATAAPAPAPVAVPRHGKPAPPRLRPAAAAEPTPRAEPPPAPLPEPAPVASTEVRPIAPTPAPLAAVAAKPAGPAPRQSSLLAAPAVWLLLGLLAAAVAAGAAMHMRHRARIARTRAALALIPSLDLSAGAFSIGRLAPVGPFFTIRARLATATTGD